MINGDSVHAPMSLDGDTSARYVLRMHEGRTHWPKFAHDGFWSLKGVVLAIARLIIIW